MIYLSEKILPVTKTNKRMSNVHMTKTLNLLLRPMIYALFFVCVCNAQAPQQRQLSADENWRIEVLLRSAM
ncbi:MAG: hypothetical protein P4L87_19980, partial [Formivibrio sp.]|nr:hypothetical protein [Formivibrio sp.]